MPLQAHVHGFGLGVQPLFLMGIMFFFFYQIILKISFYYVLSSLYFVYGWHYIGFFIYKITKRFFFDNPWWFVFVFFLDFICVLFCIYFLLSQYCIKKKLQGKQEFSVYYFYVFFKKYPRLKNTLTCFCIQIYFGSDPLRNGSPG
jgi:hypothetical protein